MEPTYKRCGDRALLAEFGRAISEDTNDLVLALDRSLEQDPVSGVTETLPTYCSLLVNFDPQKIDYDSLCCTVKQRCTALDQDQKKEYRLWEIPCCYGSYFAKDISRVMEHTGLSKEEIIRIHSETEYRIYMMGFLPGFVYLGGMDQRIVTPRLKTPRLQIPRGAVGIGGSQTGVYPVPSPGGWNLIGCTPVDFYDPMRETPVLCNAGDHIRFVPVSSCEYYDIRGAIQKNQYVPKATLVREDR